MLSCSNLTVLASPSVVEISREAFSARLPSCTFGFLSSLLVSSHQAEVLAINGTFPSWAANGSGLAGQVKGKRKVRLMDGGRKHVVAGGA